MTNVRFHGNKYFMYTPDELSDVTKSRKIKFPIKFDHLEGNLYMFNFKYIGRTGRAYYDRFKAQKSDKILISKDFSNYIILINPVYCENIASGYLEIIP